MGVPQPKQHHSIWTPEMVEISMPLAGIGRRCVARLVDHAILGVFAVVIGSAITRPHHITRRFVEASAI